MKKNILPIVLAVIAIVAIVFCFVINGQKADLQKEVTSLKDNVTKLTADLEKTKKDAADAAKAEALFVGIRGGYPFDSLHTRHGRIF